MEQRAQRKIIAATEVHSGFWSVALYIFNKQITSASAFVILIGNYQQFFHQHLCSVGFCVLTSFPFRELPVFTNRCF